MIKILLGILKVAAGLYIIICLLLYFFQEKLIFFPQKLDKGYKFDFGQKFEEIEIKTNDNKLLSGILFKANNSKGVIFYLHGNAGSISSWGKVSKTYTDLNYDVFILDYRGYGKSEGSIDGQSQFFQDIQIVYDELGKKYKEDRIVVLGYSIGTGLAAKVASTNNPRLLILQAPYYSLADMMRHTYPIIPTFILKYKFETNNYIKDCKMPIVIFHGDHDEVIYYGSSIKLREEFRKQDTLITLVGQGHNGMTDNSDYKIEIQKVLAR
ncbi:MAG TPA: alpha/beta fold hydrolase [Flavitalea sp.]|nr:alpha/beta fold hydrolase [Flavitalea sp.]